MRLGLTEDGRHEDGVSSVLFPSAPMPPYYEYEYRTGTRLDTTGVRR